MLTIAYIIHQMLLDWSHSYDCDNSALDELAYRQLLVDNTVANLFFIGLIAFLYMCVVWSAPPLDAYWHNLTNAMMSNRN